METDSFFCQLFKQLPQTLFELLGLPPERARAYRFDSVEVKKSFRIDGVLVPLEDGLPVYFVEVQFQTSAQFYAHLFAEVFFFLHENNPGQDWAAVALFESRRFEPKEIAPYQELLQSERVRRIYLDEYQMPADPPLGLGILQLVSAPEGDVKNLVARLMQKAARDSESGKKVIELAEELLIRRFSEFNREEIRKMFQLTDIRKTAVWQEACEEGKTLAKQEMVHNCLAKSMSVKEIAELLKIPVKEVRRLAKSAAK